MLPLLNRLLLLIHGFQLLSVVECELSELGLELKRFLGSIGGYSAQIVIPDAGFPLSSENGKEELVVRGEAVPDHLFGQLEAFVGLAVDYAPNEEVAVGVRREQEAVVGGKAEAEQWLVVLEVEDPGWGHLVHVPDFNQLVFLRAQR